MSGFLPFARGSLMLDFVVSALIIILPLLLYSVGKARFAKDYETHKWFQMGIAIALLIAVVLFELEMRIVGWRHLAESSPYYDTWVVPALVIHIAFATMTLICWCLVIFGALKHFTWKRARPTPDHSSRHRILGKAAVGGLTMTALTGWIFYFLAFVAS